jgi:uncharacterized protein YjeT (DUF2065 family)
MGDITAALALMLVIEGALYALFPEGMREMVLRIAKMPAGQIRAAGLFCALFGFTMLAVLKGF